MTSITSPPPSADCIFCQIIARTAEALIIHEDDRTISFLALHPNASGVDAEQSVFHFHFHLSPRFTNDGYRAWLALQGVGQTRDEMHVRFRLQPE